MRTLTVSPPNKTKKICHLIIFVIILGAVWLLHPAIQVKSYLSVSNVYYPTPPPTMSPGNTINTEKLISTTLIHLKRKTTPLKSKMLKTPKTPNITYEDALMLNSLSLVPAVSLDKPPKVPVDLTGDDVYTV